MIQWNMFVLHPTRTFARHFNREHVRIKIFFFSPFDAPWNALSSDMHNSFSIFLEHSWFAPRPLIFQKCKSLEPPSSTPGIDRDTCRVRWNISFPSCIFKDYERAGIHFNFDQFEKTVAGDGSCISLPKLGMSKICIFEKLRSTDMRKFTLGPNTEKNTDWHFWEIILHWHEKVHFRVEP